MAVARGQAAVWPGLLYLGSHFVHDCHSNPWDEEEGQGIPHRLWKHATN